MFQIDIFLNKLQTVAFCQFNTYRTFKEEEVLHVKIWQYRIEIFIMELEKKMKPTLKLKSTK